MEIKFLDNLAKSFEKLPGVGKKTAQRYAYYVVENWDEQDVLNFSKVIVETKSKIKKCKKCGMLTDLNECEICQDSTRNHQQIMVVRNTKDVLAIEKTGQYNGLYHVLDGLISPLDGISPDDLNIDSLTEKAKDVSEIILATPFTPNGETTALYLEKILNYDNLEISRISYGLPAGGDIEYVDELTLKRALDLRIKSKK